MTEMGLRNFGDTHADLRALEAFIAQSFDLHPAGAERPRPGRWTPLLRRIERGSLAALNPQPLPPFWTVMLEDLIARAEVLAEVGHAIGQPGIATGFLRRMVDDLCPPPFVIERPKPPGEPRPPRPDEHMVSPADLILLSAGLRDYARWSPHPELAAAAEEVGLQGMEAGFAALPR